MYAFEWVIVEKFMYLGSSISSIENDIKVRLAKAWIAIDRLSIIWRSDLSNEIKCNFFQAVVVSILLYVSTTWMLTKRIEEKLNGNCIKMLPAILNKCWKQHPTNQQLYRHLLPIPKTIHIRWRRHTGHCWISDIFIWASLHRHAKVGWPTRTYLLQLYTNTRCNLEDLQEVIEDWDEWWESVKEIHASSATWLWWCLLLLHKSANQVIKLILYTPNLPLITLPLYVSHPTTLCYILSLLLKYYWNCN